MVLQLSQSWKDICKQHLQGFTLMHKFQGSLQRVWEYHSPGDSMSPTLLGQEERGLTATVNKDLARMETWGTCIPLPKPVLYREPPSHLELGHARSLVIQRGYEHQATLAQTGLSRNQCTAEWGITSIDALTTSSEAQISPFVALLVHPHQLVWGSTQLPTD